MTSDANGPVVVVNVLAGTVVQQAEIPAFIADATAKDGRRETRRSRRGAIHIAPNATLRLTDDEWALLAPRPELKRALRFVTREVPKPPPAPLSPPPLVEAEVEVVVEEVPDTQPGAGEDPTEKAEEDSDEPSPGDAPKADSAQKKRRRGRRS